MAFAVFDSLEYVKVLTKAEFPEKQAEAIGEVQIMAIRAIITQVVSPAEMQELRTELRAEMHELRTELRAEMHELRTELRAEMHELHAATQKDIHDLRVEIKSVEQRLGEKISSTAYIIVGINLGAMGIAFSLFTWIMTLIVK